MHVRAHEDQALEHEEEDVGESGERDEDLSEDRHLPRMAAILGCPVAPTDVQR